MDRLGRHIAVAALSILAVRAALRMDGSWDTLMYHISAASMLGGIDVSYVLDERLTAFVQGSPPLAHLMQGLLWRLTGSLHAICTVNLLGFFVFLLFCVKKLGVRFWTVAVIALTAPLVLIHSTTGYIDLFSNAFLAIAVTGTFFLFYAKRQDDISLILWILCGLVAAAWSKATMVPIVALTVLVLLMLCVLRTRFQPPRPVLALSLVIVAGLTAAAPYLDNLITYGNPIWPHPVPGLWEWFPYFERDASQIEINRSRALLDASQFRVFLHSLFEIGHPTEYAHRPRYSIDQGQTWVAFRMGGFWAAGVVAALLSLVASAWLVARRSGIGLAVGFFLLLTFVALLPQSNELRYFQFLPLVWAALLAVVYERLRKRSPRLTSALYIVHLSMFLYICTFNLPHFRFDPITLGDMAESGGFVDYWETMEPGVTYCALGYEGEGLLLTGPTLTEFNIVSRRLPDLCPQGSSIIFHPSWEQQSPL